MAVRNRHEMDGHLQSSSPGRLRKISFNSTDRAKRRMTNGILLKLMRSLGKQQQPDHAGDQKDLTFGHGRKSKNAIGWDLEAFRADIHPHFNRKISEEAYEPFRSRHFRYTIGVDNS